MKRIGNVKNEKCTNITDDFAIEETILSPTFLDALSKKVKERVINKKVMFLIGTALKGKLGLELFDIIKEDLNQAKVHFINEGIDDLDLSNIDILFEALDYENETLTKELIKKINKDNTCLISLLYPASFLPEVYATISCYPFILDLYLPEKRKHAGLIEKIFENDSLKDKCNIYRLEESDYKKLLLPPYYYKNLKGHLAVVGGSKGFMGAPILASESAFHTGIGLVSLVSSFSLLPEFISRLPSIIFVDEKFFDSSLYSSFVIGPGINENQSDILDKVITSGKPFVLDAGALSFIKGKKAKWKGVITPHIGEWRKLTKTLGLPSGLECTESLIATLKKVSECLEVTVVLKSSVVWIYGESGRLYIYDEENPSLGVAGSGDVLAGIIGAMLNYYGAEDAAINGVLLHQIAGKSAYKKYGFYSSTDLIKEIRA